MQVIFLIRQVDRKSLRMKSTAKQEHNLNLKRDSYIPKMCVDPCAVGSTTITCINIMYLISSNKLYVPEFDRNDLSIVMNPFRAFIEQVYDDLQA